MPSVWSVRERQLKLLTTIMVTFAAVGVLLLLFEADFLQRRISFPQNPKTPSSQVSFFVSLAITVVLHMLATVPNAIVPSAHRCVVRIFATVLFINHADLTVCFTHRMFDYAPEGAAETLQVEVSRTGAIFVLLSSFAAFAVSNCAPTRPIRETLPKMLSLKGITAIVCVSCLVLGQCALWAMRDMCAANTTVAMVFNHNTPILFALVILTASIRDDHATQDLGFYLMIHFLVAAVPVFSGPTLDTLGTQDATMARVEVGFVYTGAVVLVGGWTLKRYLDGRKTTKNYNRYPLASLEVLGQGAVVVFALSGAILMWIQAGAHASEGPTASYWARLSIYFSLLAVLIPVMNLSAAVFDFRCASTVSCALTMNLAPLLCAIVANDTTVAVTVAPTGVPPTSTPTPTPSMAISTTAVPAVLRLTGALGPTLIPSATGSMVLGPFMPESFYRAAYVMILVSTLFSPMLLFVQLPGRGIEPSSNIEDMPMPTSPKLKRATPMMVFWLWLLDAAFCWSEGVSIIADTTVPHYVYAAVALAGIFSFLSQHETDVQRVVYFHLLLYVTNPKIWPLSPEASVTVAKTLLFSLGAWFVTVYAWDTPMARFEALHEDLEPENALPWLANANASATSSLLGRSVGVHRWSRHPSDGGIGKPHRQSPDRSANSSPLPDLILPGSEIAGERSKLLP